MNSNRYSTSELGLISGKILENGYLRINMFLFIVVRLIDVRRFPTVNKRNEYFLVKNDTALFAAPLLYFIGNSLDQYEGLNSNV